jgi:gamma-glutamyltranspeptidase/glutathione hydrolase
VVDRHGNIFSATPSDNGCDVPVVPGTGIAPSSRGSQSFTSEGHASMVAPGRRPRLTPNPAIAFFGDKAAMPFGTPGGDVQTQAMLQVFLNVTAFNMDLQSAVEAPRVASFSFPNSFEPHAYFPRRLNMERRISSETGAALTAMGHDVQWWPDWTWQAGSVCAIARDNATGLLIGGADPRRSAHAVGW